MNESNKWIKLHSKMTEWEWYKDANTARVFIHLLLKANWKDGKFEGQIVPRGSLAIGRKQLALELGLSEQNIRTSINHLKSTNEITINSNRKFSIITINKYEYYQQINQVANQQLTNNQPTTNQQLTTIVEYKNIDNTTTTTNIGKQENLFEFIEKIFKRPLSSTEYEVIKSWNDNELTRYAIGQAELARVFNVKYIQRILASYKQNNITTITEAEEREKKYQEEKKKKMQFNSKKETGFEYIARRRKELASKNE